MTGRHDGKTVVISGAASGIGQASAVRLAEEGARIVIADRDKADKTLQLIAGAGGKATAVAVRRQQSRERRQAEGSGGEKRRPLRYPC